MSGDLYVDKVNMAVRKSLQHMTTLTVSPCLLIYFAQAEGKNFYFRPGKSNSTIDRSQAQYEEGGGFCQEGHPSVKVSQRRIMSFNCTTMNARASTVGDAVHTRPSGLTNERGLPRQDRWARLKKQVGRFRVVS